MKMEDRCIGCTHCKEGKCGCEKGPLVKSEGFCSSHEKEESE